MILLPTGKLLAIRLLAPGWASVSCLHLLYNSPVLSTCKIHCKCTRELLAPSGFKPKKLRQVDSEQQLSIWFSP